MGFRWDFTPDGRINDGTNDCFDGALALHIGGARFASNRPMMTPDSNEYVLEKTKGNLKVTRRILVDRRLGAARYLEVFENTGSEKQDVQVSLNTVLGGSQIQFVTSAGKPFTGALGRADAGLLALRGDQRPCVMFLVAGRGAKVRPGASVTNGNRNVAFTYSLAISAGKTVTLLHVIAQRNGVTPQTAPAVFKTFCRGRPVRPAVPRGLAGTVANFGGVSGSSGDDGGPFAVSELADALGVELGDGDALVMGEDAVLTGAVRCAALAVETVRGRVEVPFGEVAAVAGGAGTGRPGRIYMRTGEILAGRIEARGLELRTERFAMSLRPEQVNVLFARRSPADGKPPEGAVAFLGTRLGERLAVKGAGAGPPLKGAPRPAGVVLEAATAWGTLRVPLDEVESLARREGEGTPLQRLALRSGLRLSVILCGGDIEVETARFGKVKVRPAEIASLARIAKEEPKPAAAGRKWPDDVLKKLEKSLDAKFTDSALSEVLQALSAGAGLTIKLDLGSDDETTKALARKISFKAGEMALSALLEKLAGQEGLSLACRGGAVVLTKADGPDEDTEDKDEDGEAGAGAPDAPSFVLAGDNVLVGDIDLRELRIMTDAGPTTVRTADVLSMERAEASDGFRAAFTFELVGGDRLAGSVEEAILPVRTGRGPVLRVPVEHIVSFKRPRPPEDEAGESEEEEREPAAGEGATAPALEVE